jgi:hypothetical protein
VFPSYQGRGQARDAPDRWSCAYWSSGLPDHLTGCCKFLDRVPKRV